ncbi:hypothetical protein Trydic_g22232 [Trypoxylus dichotomus]
MKVEGSIKVVQGPDLNPIEISWEELDRKVREVVPTSEVDLWKKLFEAWDNTRYLDQANCLHEWSRISQLEKMLNSFFALSKVSLLHCPLFGLKMLRTVPDGSSRGSSLTSRVGYLSLRRRLPHRWLQLVVKYPHRFSFPEVTSSKQSPLRFKRALAVPGGSSVY